MRHKEEGKMPILYEKYKKEHPQHGGARASGQEGKKKRKGLLERAGNAALAFILLGMIALSAVGIITLLHPEMNHMLKSLIERGF